MPLIDTINQCEYKVTPVPDTLPFGVIDLPIDHDYFKPLCTATHYFDWSSGAPVKTERSQADIDSGLAAAEQAQVNFDARKYLSETDWYSTRAFDTGVPMPADIAAGRQAARDSIAE